MTDVLNRNTAHRDLLLEDLVHRGIREHEAQELLSALLDPDEEPAIKQKIKMILNYSGKGRKAVLELISNHHDNRARCDLLDILGNPDPRVRRGFTQRDDSETYEVLVSLLRDSNLEVRARAFAAVYYVAVGAKNAGEAMTTITELIGDTDAQWNLEAIATLASLARHDRRAVNTGTISRLGALLTAERPAVRKYAAWALGQMNVDEPSIVPKVMALLKESDPEARSTARKTLANMVALRQLVIKRVFGELPSAKPEYQRELLSAAFLLDDIGAECIPVLAKMVSENTGELGTQAAAILARMGSLARSAEEEIEEAMGRALLDDRVYLATSLWKITKNAPKVVGVLKEGLRSRRRETREEAIYYLGEVGPRAAFASGELMRISVEEEDPVLRNMARIALKKLQGDQREGKTERVETEGY